MTEQWRLILDPARDGAANMALDEALLWAVGARRQPPTLRLYRWEPACLSLGYAQPAADADQARLAERGWHVVRRLTGGRAILHTDELTYSITLPHDHPLAAGSIVESYHRISGALLLALDQLGAAVQADRKAEGARLTGPVCFEVPSDYEITANGRKLVGSAQVRKGQAVLQHGSLPLTGDVARICDALAFPDEAARAAAKDRVRARAATFEEAAGHPVSWEAAAAAVAAGFGTTFALDLRESAYSAAEIAKADELRESRYAAASWTLRQ